MAKQGGQGGQADAQPVTLRVAAYVRYSSRNQRDGYSIAAQQVEIEREAQGWQARTGEVWQIAWYIEPERSARAEKVSARVVFRKLLDDAHAGACDMVVVHKLDRFARSLRHQLQFIHELATDGVSFYSVVEKPDFTSPQGRMVANMFGVLAQFYSDNLGQEVKKGLYQRAQRGYPWGALPFGYCTNTHAATSAGERAGSADTASEHTADDATDDASDDASARTSSDGLPDETHLPSGAAIPDPHDWEGYQTIKRLILAGASDTQVATWLNADGRWWPAPTQAGKFQERGTYTRARRPWTFWAVRRIRTNEFYRPFTPGDDRGTVHVRSQRYRGLHLAACTWDEWQTMQTMNRVTFPRTGDAATYSVGEFRGLAACAACGERLYIVRSYLRDHATHAVRAVYERMECPSYRWFVSCPSAGGVVRAQDLSAAWARWLAAAFPEAAFPPDWERTVLQQYESRLRATRARQTKASMPGDRRDRKRLQADLNQWQARRQAAIDARLDGWIDARDARQRVAEADTEMARLHAALAGTQDPDAEARRTAEVEALLRTGHQVATWATLWPQMTRDERMRAASLMIESEGLRVRIPAKGKRGRHNATTAVPPSAEELDQMIVEVRLRPDFAHALDVLKSVQSVQSVQSASVR